VPKGTEAKKTLRGSHSKYLRRGGELEGKEGQKRNLKIKTKEAWVETEINRILGHDRTAGRFPWRSREEKGRIESSGLCGGRSKHCCRQSASENREGKNKQGP